MIRPAFSIYDASAGSGKTFTLAKEYLKIILTSPSDEAYKHILAITFTNKAVAEMKKRILNYLLEFADKEKHSGSVMLDEIIKDIQKDANYIQQKSVKILKNIIHNYAAFDVMTIDKFTAKVIRTFAFDFQIHPQFDISLDTETLLEEAIDALIAQAGSEQKLTDTLIDFALDKTEEDKSWDISYDLMEVGKLLTRENHRLEIEAFQDQPIEVFEYLKKTLYAKKALLEEDIKQLIEEVFKTLQDSGIERETFSAQYYPKHLDKIKSTFLMPDRKYTEEGNFKTNKNAKGKEEVVALIPYFVETNTQIYALIGKRDFILATLQNLTPLSLLQA
ncbi:MAG: UvrD-helicase domain-containing protein, partial [Flavobacterium sp.]